MFLIENTAPMFGSKHLIGLLMMALLSAAYLIPLILLRNKMSENAKYWVLRGTALSLWALELLKFIILLREYGYVTHGEFPFHLCSVPLYIFPFVAFGKGKISQYLKAPAFTVGLVAGLITLIYPSNVLGGDHPWFSMAEELFPLRSFLFHTIIILFAVYMLISKVFTFRQYDLFRSLSVVGGGALFAIILNTLIPNADYFLIGRGYGSPLQFIYNTSPALYTISMIGLGLLVVGLIYLPIELTIYFRNKKENTLSEPEKSL